VDAVFVLSPHHEHARQVVAALHSGKHVFVEKPLCLTDEELDAIEYELRRPSSKAGLLMVGFNRRFAPASLAARQFFAGTADPLAVSIRFNAGAIPEDHWIQDDQIGGGRIIGEACHAIDLATFLTGAPVVRVFAESIGGDHAPCIRDDQSFITMRHANGSVSNVAYLAGGDKGFAKERVEVFGGGKVAVIDDFRLAEAYSGGKRRRLWKGAQDKGHSAELRLFIDAIRLGTPAPISWEEIRATSLASILAVRSLREGLPCDILPTTAATNSGPKRLKAG
jgi:predicted dehydrogenase